MNRRLQDIIKYKTGGRQTAFAALLNWSPQYLSKLLKGVDFGLQPVVSIIEALPEIRERLNVREREINVKFATAAAKSDELCRQKTAKR